MSEANATVQTANVPATWAEFDARCQLIPWWAMATDHEQRLMYAEYRTCPDTVVPNREGDVMGLDEYLDVQDDGSGYCQHFATEFPSPDAWLQTCLAARCDNAAEQQSVRDSWDAWLQANGDQFPAPKQGVQAPVQPAVQQTPEQAAQQQKAEQAAKQAAIDGHKTAGDKALLLAAKAVQRAEKGLAASMLQAGKHALACIRHYSQAGVSRPTTIKALEGRWAEAGSDVTVNVAVPCYQAYRCLQEEPGVKADVSWSAWKNAWRQLVAQGKDADGLECWTLLPGLEDQCRAEFARIAAMPLRDMDAATAAVRTLVQKHAANQAAATKRAADEAAAVEEAAKVKRAATLDAEKAAEQEFLAAKAKADAATTEEREEFTANAAAAKEALLDQQRKLAVDHAAVEQAKRDRERKERLDKEAKAAADKEAAKQAAAARKAAEKQAAEEAAKNAPKPAGATARPGVEQPQCKAPAVDMAAIAKQGTTKDVATMATEFVLEAEDNEGVFLAMHDMLQGKMSGRMDAAIQAFQFAYQAFKAPASTGGGKPIVLTDAERAAIAARNGKATARAG